MRAATASQEEQHTLPTPEEVQPAIIQPITEKAGPSSPPSHEVQVAELEALLCRLKATITVRARNADNFVSRHRRDTSVSVQNPIPINVKGLQPPEELEIHIGFGERLQGESESYERTRTMRTSAQSSTGTAPERDENSTIQSATGNSGIRVSLSQTARVQELEAQVRNLHMHLAVVTARVHAEDGSVRRHL